MAEEVNTFEAMLRLAEKQNSQPRRKPYKNEEHKIQEACVRWFRGEYPHIGKLLHSIPNGGLRNKGVAVSLKREGMQAGVPDLCLPIPINGCGALYIEMKTEVGRLRPEQKSWMELATAHKNICVVVRSLEAFIYCVTNYLSGNHDALIIYKYG